MRRGQEEQRGAQRGEDMAGEGRRRGRRGTKKKIMYVFKET